MINDGGKLLNQFSITFMSGPRDGDCLTFDLRLMSPLLLTIGRREDADIDLSYDNQVSRLHAHLGCDGNEFWLEDMDSRNGTFVDEERLPPSEKTPIEPGTLFKIGRTWLRLDPLPSDITSPVPPVNPPSDDSLPE